MKEKENIRYGDEINIKEVDKLLESAGYHDPEKRLKESATIKIYEDKKVYDRLDEIERRINIVVKMLAKIGYLLEGK